MPVCKKVLTGFGWYRVNEWKTCEYIYIYESRSDNQTTSAFSKSRIIPNSVLGNYNYLPTGSLFFSISRVFLYNAVPEIPRKISIAENNYYFAL